MGSIRRTVVMRSFWSDPFLWIHLAGLAALPIWLVLCLLGLAAGDPVLPFWLEIGLVAFFGIAPILWMQWQRPFDIFSLLIVTLKPERLSDDQRRLLTLFKNQRNRVLAVFVSVGMLLLLQWLYNMAPIAASVTPLGGSGRSLGLLWAAVAFLGCNLFVQVPVSVLSVLLYTDAAFAATQPFPVELIRRNFTLLGLPLNQILPPIVAESAKTEPRVADSKGRSQQSVICDSQPSAPSVSLESENEVDVVDAVDPLTDPWDGETAASPPDTPDPVSDSTMEAATETAIVEVLVSPETPTTETVLASESPVELAAMPIEVVLAEVLEPPVAAMSGLEEPAAETEIADAEMAEAAEVKIVEADVTDVGVADVEAADLEVTPVTAAQIETDENTPLDLGAAENEQSEDLIVVETVPTYSDSHDSDLSAADLGN